MLEKDDYQRWKVEITNARNSSVNVEIVVREQCVFAVRDEVIFAGLHGCRLRPLQVVIGTRCAIV